MEDQAIVDYQSGPRRSAPSDAVRFDGPSLSKTGELATNPVPADAVSLERGRHTHELVERSGYFGVSVLSDQHKELSDRFAGRLTESGDRFAGLETFRLVTETPLLSVALAAFDCRVIATHPVGTHTLFIGEVLAIQNQEGGSPLLYFNQAYHKLNDGG